MRKVLVATDKPFAKTASDQIREIFDQAGYQCNFLEKYGDQQNFVQAVADAEAIIIRSDIVDDELMAAAPNLKIVVRAGAGYDNVDLKAATARDVVVMNTPGQNSNAVAELAFGMMLYQIRNRFSGGSGTELMGKTLGIHGYGNIGKHVGRIAKGFGMTVYAYHHNPARNAEIEQDGISPVNSPEELYKKCQYISLNIPAREQNKKIINKDLLGLMPENAMLVNTARKEVICEDSLKQIFAERKDFSYVSDLAPGNAAELAEYANRMFFPPKKMGAQTAEANINAGLAAARQIIAFFKDNDIRFKVN
ncbi:MAG: NAD(P)-dependent oxidoreductase [Bacteroidales bacterium]|jgi:D-3-phosphoglycerate dehydrogenase|nr:NAD(P)-binding domain-containing protein [Bacteroidales bacterium]MDD3701490.1 NAD(P)-dependent oxidoreductase [Bacteroidales bacterium]MDY0369217.1 NAD(P)-dependent oxidoreductase [Bacteroidales bacterium]